MSRFTHQDDPYWQQMLSVMRNEFRTIFTDAAWSRSSFLRWIIYATVYFDGLAAQPATCRSAWWTNAARRPAAA